MRNFLLSLLCLTALLCTQCRSSTEKLRIGASPVPHADLLHAVEKELSDQGIRLHIIEIDDYNIPNRLLAEKQIEANFFQHLPFLEIQNQQQKYDLVPLVRVHIEPLGIYSKNYTSLSALPKGSILAIPSDPTNEGRALLLLADLGLIGLKENAGLLVTPQDVICNPQDFCFIELDAPFLPRALPDVAAACIPSNVALQAGRELKAHLLAQENAASPYANIVAVRREDLSTQKMEALKQALTSPRMRQYIEEKYKGVIAPAF